MEGWKEQWGGQKRTSSPVRTCAQISDCCMNKHREQLHCMYIPSVFWKQVAGQRSWIARPHKRELRDTLLEGKHHVHAALSACPMPCPVRCPPTDQFWTICPSLMTRVYTRSYSVHASQLTCAACEEPVRLWIFPVFQMFVCGWMSEDNGVVGRARTGTGVPLLFTATVYSQRLLRRMRSVLSYFSRFSTC